eukprot:COSAG06_NODE_2112_length_7564_cov_4.547354_7_plen_76_part_00
MTQIPLLLLGTVDTSVQGGLAWGASLNQNFVSANQTSSVAWSLIWSTLDGLEYSNRGMMGVFLLLLCFVVWDNTH